MCDEEDLQRLGRGGYSDGENSLWSKSKKTFKIVRKMLDIYFPFSPAYKIIAVTWGPQNKIKILNEAIRNPEVLLNSASYGNIFFF